MKISETLMYKDNDLIPAVVQDEKGQVIMVAYMNQEAIEHTAATKEATFWSRSRQELWIKGKTSGNTLEVLEIRTDCDADCILLKVKPAGPACHTGYYSCFYQRWQGSDWEIDGEKLKDPKEMYGK